MLADHSLGIPNDWGVTSVSSACTKLPSQAKEETRQGGANAVRPAVAPAILPPPLSGGTLTQVAMLEQDVPTNEALVKYLQDRGLDTAGWGKGDFKSTKKLWEELDQKEAGLETWTLENGQTQLVRVTHVLRARVCSSESLAAGVYLFNTWQQFANGRKRTRNGLLSEKLTLSELPLEEHLMEVCGRAVCEEEMQRVAEVTFSVGPHSPPPPYDPEYKCPIQVNDAIFIEHTIEVETSKSYPGLLTMYHLYTVDIVCSGLPRVNFNTLEFEHPDDEGRRKLKYVHAWVWLEWPQIKRYLFEGSEMKERKTKGSFKDEAALRAWLSQFNLDLASWGTGPKRSVKDLMKELDKEEAYLELWGRHDGAAMLMRVVHVLQVQVKIANSPHLVGKFLLQTWQQQLDGTVRTIYRPMSCKLSSSELPFDEERFTTAAKEVMERQLSTIVDAYFQLHPGLEPPNQSQFEASHFGIENVEFIDHRFDLEESPSFKGMHTMYHLYTMEAFVTGLPQTDFTTLDFHGKHGISVNGWTWTSWQQVMDSLHARIQTAERSVLSLAKSRHSEVPKLEAINKSLAQAAQEMKRATLREENQDTELPHAIQLLASSRKELAALQATAVEADKVKQSSIAAALPPSMVSRMATETIATAGFLDQVNFNRFMRAPTGQFGAQPTSSGLLSDAQHESETSASDNNKVTAKIGSGGASSSGVPHLASGVSGSKRSTQPRSPDVTALSNVKSPSKRSALSTYHKLALGVAAVIAVVQFLLCAVLLAHEAQEGADAVNIVIAIVVALGSFGIAGSLFFFTTLPLPTAKGKVRIGEEVRSDSRITGIPEDAPLEAHKTTADQSMVTHLSI
mmetsp:Transcript_66888/g.160142  ORF Transcript_66888/g.160142 Transcript_66888/m.160142 type:complete len:848 (+) Transcript_66888:112-2655(+)|eukprot:CAMPEP_0178409762 /NCGR_PEP_ID=MMETSP0689_2-20121128/20628_1 /TAXON_ID=160604 /ORGANISM="Amphidinium massartii, Strain CS-259" /LENGTH=847 /DNA_ID=CAMNT_0020030911 /DNA_START=22 /DNA_END=2565 /DNA_ORIENTATION=-